jgi:dTDP-4-dehydrorhamnose reductase
VSHEPVRVLITGAAGQLGRALLASAGAGRTCIPLDRAGCEIADAGSVEAVMAAHRPQLVVNAAAYTAVDRAESEPEAAERANALGPAVLAEACVRHDARLVHLSTDFVFDGRGHRPYRPDDPTGPRSVYGRTKLEGERRVAEIAAERSLIVRTAWLYDATSRNFVTTMLRLMRERDEVRVIADQVGTPTSSASLARGIWALVDAGAAGTHHWTDAGVASWYDFAAAIRRISVERALLPESVRVVPIATEEYPTPAVRPAYSVLDKREAWAAAGFVPLHWEESLAEVLAALPPSGRAMP